MSNIYLGAGKGDTPRSCNSEAYLKNYDAIFRKKKKTQSPRLNRVKPKLPFAPPKPR